MARTISMPSVRMDSEVIPVWGRARATMMAPRARSRRRPGTRWVQGLSPSRCLGPFHRGKPEGPRRWPPTDAGPRRPEGGGAGGPRKGVFEPEHQTVASGASPGREGSGVRGPRSGHRELAWCRRRDGIVSSTSCRPGPGGPRGLRLRAVLANFTMSQRWRKSGTLPGRRVDSTPVHPSQ